MEGYNYSGFKTIVKMVTCRHFYAYTSTRRNRHKDDASAFRDSEYRIYFIVSLAPGQPFDDEHPYPAPLTESAEANKEEHQQQNVHMQKHHHQDLFVGGRHVQKGPKHLKTVNDVAAVSRSAGISVVQLFKAYRIASFVYSDLLESTRYLFCHADRDTSVRIDFRYRRKFLV